MKSLTCPKCGSEIAHYWVNKKRANQRVGRCPQCKKVVNLGKADEGDQQGKQTGAEAATKKAAGKTSNNKTAAAPSANRQRAGAGKRPVPPGRNIRPEPGPSSKRSGEFGRFIRDFFELG